MKKIRIYHLYDITDSHPYTLEIREYDDGAVEISVWRVGCSGDELFIFIGDPSDPSEVREFVSTGWLTLTYRDEGFDIIMNKLLDDLQEWLEEYVAVLSYNEVIK